MKRFLSCTLALALILSFGLSASAKKRRKPYEQRAGDAGASAGLSIPITDDGSGFLFGAWGGYNLLNHLDATMSLGVATDADGNTVFGNPIVSMGTALWPTKMKKGWGAYLEGRLNLGLGLFGIDNDQRKAAALGMATRLNWLRFLSEHLVIGPEISGGLRLGSISMSGSVVPQIGVPFHHTQGRETEVAIRYRFGLGTGFGDHRGGLGVGVGMTGLAPLTNDEDENRFTLDLGLGVNFRVVKKHYLRISAGLNIPMKGDFFGTNVIVGGSVSWGYAVEIEDEEDNAKAGGSTELMAPYGIWMR